MKTILFIFFAAMSTLVCQATVERYPEFPDYEVVSKEVNTSLKKNRTKMIFQITGLEGLGSKQRIVWSANKWIDTTTLGATNELKQVFISGTYNFKFYVNSTYKEIIIPKMKLEAGYTITVRINFKLAERENMMVKKPVIYLYPQETTEVNVQVDPIGKLTFTYPNYPSTGWNIMANPTGELSINDHSYNYLFWEAEQTFDATQFDLHSGFVVTKENTIAFLEEQLTAYGMNSKEQADFITFWGPQLMRNESNFIHFIFNDEANQFASLTIDPTPDHVNRIYIVYFDSEDVDFSELHPQIIPVIDRNGFSVLEWGGSEIPSILPLEN